jgi:hypothetical protein
MTVAAWYPIIDATDYKPAAVNKLVYGVSVAHRVKRFYTVKA